MTSDLQIKQYAVRGKVLLSKENKNGVELFELLKICKININYYLINLKNFRFIVGNVSYIPD